jgi:hypothetical protein
LFQLLQPIWLFALAGLSIPVIIHLWNQRPGKTWKVGSIALVTENTVSYKKSVQLSEILLLILRCLLLSCIAIALAGPLWRSPVNKQAKGWVLMDRQQQLTATYNRFKPVVDSLLQVGMEFHYFEEGFAKENLKNALKAAPDTIDIEPASYRGLTALLNEQVDALLPVYIFTNNYMRNFGGNRPEVLLNLHWFTYAPDTVRAKIFTDTTALHVTVLGQEYSNDARYVTAALGAIQQFSKRNIVTKVVTTVADIPPEQDWLFWLDDELPVNAKDAKNMLVYAKGKRVSAASYILPAGNLSFTAIDLYTYIIEKDPAQQFQDIHWKDGYGHPLLTAQRLNNTTYYRLYTHINPAWNELPWSDNFPILLYELMFGGHHAAVLGGATDKTIIDPEQVMPVIINEKGASPRPAIFTEIKLAGVFWLTAFILFFAERCLSFYRRKTDAHE